jgi:hypothetical protein
VKSVCGPEFDTDSDMNIVDLFRKFFDLTLKQGRWNAWVSWREDTIQLVDVSDNISMGGVDQKVWMYETRVLWKRTFGVVCDIRYCHSQRGGD